MMLMIMMLADDDDDDDDGFASFQTTESAPGVAAKLLSMRQLAILSHTLRGGISRVQLLALQGHNHTSERVD